MKEYNIFDISNGVLDCVAQGLSVGETNSWLLDIFANENNEKYLIEFADRLGIENHVDLFDSIENKLYDSNFNIEEITGIKINVTAGGYYIFNNEQLGPIEATMIVHVYDENESRAIEFEIYLSSNMSEEMIAENINKAIEEYIRRGYIEGPADRWQVYETTVKELGPRIIS